jgi:nitrogen fixation protein FixH
MSTHKLTHSGNILLIGFAGMLVMMSVLVYLSMKQDVSMVSNNYYEQELVYQHKLDAMNNTISYDKLFSLTANNGEVLLQIPASLSKGITEGSVYFYCPSNEKLDYKENLKATPTGTYLFSKNIFQGAGYKVKVSFHSGGKDYYKELKLD